MGSGAESGLDQVGVDQDGAQALHAETLDKAHPAHIGGQVVDFHRALNRAHCIFFLAQIHAEHFGAGYALVPLRQRFLIHGADFGKALFVETAHQ